jgi:hypothetical protein
VSLTIPQPPTVGAPFAVILDGLCRAVAERAVVERGFAPVAILLWGWLRRVSARFSALAARAAAGPVRLRPLRPRLHRDLRASPPHVRPRLPRGFGWLGRAVPRAWPFGGQLAAFLAEPEVVALLAAAPQAARHLRPLCRMLGVRPHPALPPPRRAPPAPLSIASAAPVTASAATETRPRPPVSPAAGPLLRRTGVPAPAGRSFKPG